MMINEVTRCAAIIIFVSSCAISWPEVTFRDVINTNMWCVGCLLLLEVILRILTVSRVLPTSKIRQHMDNDTIPHLLTTANFWRFEFFHVDTKDGLGCA